MKDLDCVVIGCDIINKGSFEKVKQYFYPLVKKDKLCNLIYLIANKIDLFSLEKVDFEEVIEFTEKKKSKIF